MVVAAAVEFLLENIKELLVYHRSLISGSLTQFEELEEGLQFFKFFRRKSATASRRGDSPLQEIIHQIREVVYEAEDASDAFVTQAAKTKSRILFLGAFQPENLPNAIKNVKDIRSKIRDVYGDMSRIDFTSCFVGDGGPQKSKARRARQDNVVGFEDEAEKLIGYLKEDTEQLDVISVFGMPGLGKTTLAWMIFHDPRIRDEFPTRIWVYVSQEFTKKNVFLTILREFSMLSDEK